MTDPPRALDTFREGLAYTRQHRLPVWEAFIARDAAGLEAVHGNLDQGLDMFIASINLFHQSGDTTNLAMVFARLAMFFDWADRPQIAATIYGTTTHNTATNQIFGLAGAVDNLRDVLGTGVFDDCVRVGAAMDLADAVRYAHVCISTTRRHRT